jgi:putative Mn2+ efflux pump MntP
MYKPKGHVIQNRMYEIIAGILLFVIGSYLLYDAFDNRGKKMPWPGGAITPW